MVSFRIDFEVNKVLPQARQVVVVGKAPSLIDLGMLSSQQRHDNGHWKKALVPNINNNNNNNDDDNSNNSDNVN